MTYIMKNFSTLRLALFATAMASTTLAVAAPTDIKSAMIERCADEAVQLKMTDAASAKKVCSCTINVQANQLKLGEFWEIQSTAMKGQNPNNLPALKRIQGDLDKCRAGIKMNPPQLPQQSPAKK
ncbi:hypothetical protein ACF3NA_03130 [Alkanindiges sp. WGS2144]|uniref:hypothetical protein n=1 Tax=Alkanindiges sp. WGS2144 TaxID=3366808 RepID=UPI003752D59D